MKSHKYWSIGAMITMLGTFYTGYKKNSETRTWNDQSETADVLNKTDNGCSNRAI